MGEERFLKGPVYSEVVGLTLFTQEEGRGIGRLPPEQDECSHLNVPVPTH